MGDLSNGLQRSLGLLEGRMEAMHSSLEAMRIHLTDQSRKIETLERNVEALEKRWTAHDNWERGARGVWIMIASGVGAVMGWVASAWEGVVRWFNG